MDLDLGGWWNRTIDFFYSLLLSLMVMLQDMFIFLYESFMDVCISIINGFGSVMSVFDVTQYFSSLPASVLNILGLIDLGTCTQMVAAAIAIRILLQLIPFTRLGS